MACGSRQQKPRLPPSAPRACAASDQLQGKLDVVAAENARLSQGATARDVVLGDARARIEFLETALSAAEAECTRLTAERGSVREMLESKSKAINARLEAMSARAVTAEKLLEEASERLLARIVARPTPSGKERRMPRPPLLIDIKGFFQRFSDCPPVRPRKT